MCLKVYVKLFNEFIKRNITIQIVTHRVDFSCLAFVLLQIYVSTAAKSYILNYMWTAEMSIGLDLDWTGSGLVTNFVGFGLDSDCDFLHKFRIRTGFGLS